MVLLPVAVVLAVILNICATFVLVLSARYDTQQKWWQMGIIWLLPVIGAILVWSLARDATGERVTTDFRNRAGFDDGDLREENYSSGGGGSAESSGDGGGSD